MITENYTLKLLVIFIVIDVFFGILRSIKEKTLASSIGIDGIIRKVGMIASIIFCIIIDKMIKNLNKYGDVLEDVSLKKYNN